MSILVRKQQVLEILIENLNNPQPQVMPSEVIAHKLDLSVEETCHLFKIMNEMGVIISDPEGQNALITREGVNYISQWTSFESKISNGVRAEDVVF